MIVNENTIINILKAGGVVGIPTDTVYGLACLKGFSEKIYKIKKRDKNKKLITMITSIKYFKQLDHQLMASMEKNWPGATTYILDYKHEMTAFRIPNEQNLLSLLQALDCELLTTSANISGESPCVTKEEFEIRFPDIALLEEHYLSVKSGTPSTILLYNKGVLEKIR